MPSDTVHSFDVFTSDHDQVKAGVIEQVRSRVNVSSEDFPSTAEAAQVAACLAIAVHGGMATSVLLRV